MAKEKKKVLDFREALKQNVREAVEQSETSIEAQINVMLNESTWQRFVSLAKRNKLPAEKLAQLALEHFIRLEKMWFPGE